MTSDRLQKLHFSYHLIEDATGYRLTDILEVHFLEIVKLADLAIQRDENDAVVAEKNKDIKKDYDLLQVISKDEKARMLYEAREAELRDQLTRIETAENKGVAKGKILMAQDAICQYLAARLGVESQALQETVRTITDLDTLSRIMNQIFIVTHLDEATSLIHMSTVSQ
ncbi:MAG: Rpn family recombination-promoting nuclease/putative transposase [Desulfitobacteriaceae bacterium]